MDPTPLISVDEAKEYLGKTTAMDDYTLNRMIEVASLCCEEYTGRHLRPSEQTVALSGEGKSALFLRPPVRSVTSVTVDGEALTAGGWCVKAAAGLLYRGSTPGAGVWPVGADNVTVVYEAGPVEPSPIAVHAAFEMLRHLWETQRGGPNRGDVRGDDWVSGMGYTFPNRVMQLLDPMRVPGIA